MKITIIQFSPSGNTQSVSQTIKSMLEEKEHIVQHLEISGNDMFFNSKNIADFLSQNICQHDVLLIGGPVYAHHMQYHVLDIIKALPRPDSKWGKIAIPYATYGGISSGVALKESAAMLKASGRVVPLAMKISAPHRVTRGFLPKEFNSDKLKGEQLKYIQEFVNRISLLEMKSKIKDNSKHFNYNGLLTSILAKIIFVEKTFQNKRYPKVVIEQSKCNKCGLCVKTCPVLHLKKGENNIEHSTTSACIHCLNCVVQCKSKAIYLKGNLEKTKAFMNKMMAKKGNKEQPESAVYPILDIKLLNGNSRIGNFIYSKMFRSLESKIRYKKYNPVTALKSAGVEDAKRVLEIGCGSGYYTLPAARLISEETQYHAVDIHPMSIEEMTKKMAAYRITNIKLSQMNAMNTLLPDCSVDLILLFGVIPAPFLPLDQLLPEMWRILEPGGRIAVWTINGFNLSENITKTGLFELNKIRNDVYLFEKNN